MQKLHFLAAAAVLLGTTACPVDVDDPFDTLTTTLTNGDEVDTSGTESGNDNATTDATSTNTTNGTTDTTDGACGGLGCACADSTTCDAGLECIGGTCQLPGSDTTTDSTTDTGMMLGDCDMANEYCLGNGCTTTTPMAGQGLTLDTNMDGTADWGFCQFPCMNNDASMCPTLDGAQIQCVQWNNMGDQACFPLCELANDTCPAGMMCLDAGIGMGAGLCVSDAAGFG